MIRLLAALPSEARPLIDLFRLKRDMNHAAFPIYRDENITLVVCGIGKTRAAAAVAYSQGVDGVIAPWLNVGIAGHSAYKIGVPLRIGRIRDQATGKDYYPPIVQRWDCDLATLTTVDNAEFEYASDSAYDMEAAGFYQTATRFVSGELVQCLKIISDNRESPTANIDRNMINELIGDQLSLITQAMDDLQSLQAMFATSDHALGVDQYFSRWRFTVAQRHRFTALLKQWSLRSGDTVVPKEKWHGVSSAAQAIARIEVAIAALPVQITAEKIDA